MAHWQERQGTRAWKAWLLLAENELVRLLPYLLVTCMQCTSPLTRVSQRFRRLRYAHVSSDVYLKQHPACALPPLASRLTENAMRSTIEATPPVEREHVLSRYARCGLRLGECATPPRPRPSSAAHWLFATTAMSSLHAMPPLSTAAPKTNKYEHTASLAISHWYKLHCQPPLRAGSQCWHSRAS